MRLTTPVLSVVVVAVFLCMLDKHVFGEEVECNTQCPDKYEPVCTQPSEQENFETFRNQCELDKAKKCKGGDAYIFIKKGECTD